MQGFRREGETEYPAEPATTADEISMNAELTGDLIDPIAARHAELLGVLARGIRDVCIALWYIRQESTYRAQGFESFGGFLRSLHYSAATGRLWANSGPMIEELRSTGDEHLISHPDLVRPIALLLSPLKQPPDVQARVIRRQAEIVRVAAAVAHKGLEPLTEDVVARVAKNNYGIKSREEYRAARRSKQQEEPAPLDALEWARRRRERIDLAFATILDYEDELRRSGEDLAELRERIGFERVLFLLIDARDA